MNRKKNADGTFRKSHGMTRTRLYRVWCGMKERCSNPNNKSFERYGDRGINVCDEWMKFEPFMNWSLSNGYGEGLTIDRINNDRGYSPDNCRWVDYKTQNRNYSRNHIIEFNGETHCISDWSDITGINRATILWRLKAGKPLEEVLKKGDNRYGKKRI